MFYKLDFDMERDNKELSKGKNSIYAQQSNLKEIEYPGFKKGFFNTIIFSNCNIKNWPEVIFYYSSKASRIESDYLINIVKWPIIHIRVMKKLQESGIKGILYLPIKLYDVVTNTINLNYVVMYITNFIDGYDMEKSHYEYLEKYDYYTFLPGKTFLNHSICDGYDIFRCTKNKPAIYVSQKFKDIIDVNKFIGFRFYEHP